MHFSPKRDDTPDINLTPLIDVVFLLLIFFMVSTTFDKDAEIQISLPEATGQPAQKEKFTLDPNSLDVVLQRSHEGWLVNGRCHQGMLFAELGQFQVQVGC